MNLQDKFTYEKQTAKLLGLNRDFLMDRDICEHQVDNLVHVDIYDIYGHCRVCGARGNEESKVYHYSYTTGMKWMKQSDHDELVNEQVDEKLNGN